MAAVLIAPNINAVTENAKFRFEYQVSGSVRGHFDWTPAFGDSSAELAANLIDVAQAHLLAKHALTISDDEIIILGMPISTAA